MASTESEIQKSILAWLHLNRVFAYRTNNIGVPLKNGGFRPSPVKGLPDICGVLPGGKALYVEVKRPGNALSENQELFINNAEKAGALCIVAYSLDYVINTLTPYL